MSADQLSVFAAPPTGSVDKALSTVVRAAATERARHAREQMQEAARDLRLTPATIATSVRQTAVAAYHAGRALAVPPAAAGSIVTRVLDGDAAPGQGRGAP
jgi:hypothetical protein